MLRETENSIKITGTCHSIEVIPFTSVKGDSFIRGSVSVDTGNESIVPVSFIAKEGSKVAQGIHSLVAETATVEAAGRDAADTITVNLGSVEENFFVPKGTDVVVETFNVKAPFFSKKAGAANENEFMIEGQILNVSPEIVKDVPTGDMIVRLFTSGYQGKANILNLTISKNEPAAVSYVQNNFTAGQLVKLKGRIEIVETLNEQREKSAFGEDIISYTKSFVKKLMVNSATPPMESNLDQAELQQSLAAREAAIKEAKKKSKSTSPATAAPKAQNFSL